MPSVQSWRPSRRCRALVSVEEVWRSSAGVLKRRTMTPLAADEDAAGMMVSVVALAWSLMLGELPSGCSARSCTSPGGWDYGEPPVQENRAGRCLSPGRGCGCPRVGRGRTTPSIWLPSWRLKAGRRQRRRQFGKVQEPGAWKPVVRYDGAVSPLRQIATAQPKVVVLRRRPMSRCECRAGCVVQPEALSWVMAGRRRVCAQVTAPTLPPGNEQGVRTPTTSMPGELIEIRTGEVGRWRSLT